MSAAANTTPASVPWFETLTGSVAGLFEAAREYRHAHRAAELVAESGRRPWNPHEGRITLGPAHGPGGRERPARSTEPHGRAAATVQRLHEDLARELHAGFERAALLYASGTAWAIRQIQTGQQPARVRFETDEDGRRALPHEDMKIEGLTGRYAKTPRLTAAYDALYAAVSAGKYAEDLAGRDYVSEREAGEMFEAGADARAIPEAAYQYGLRAEMALHFVLLGPRADHARQQAAERAAAQNAGDGQDS
ncbi:hypothetical protein ACWEFL_15900 [Streptomyces sp. NPDC004838]